MTIGRRRRDKAFWSTPAEEPGGGEILDEDGDIILDETGDPILEE